MYPPVQAPCPLVCWCWCAAGAVHLWAAQGGGNALIVLTGGWWVIIIELSILMDLQLSINLCCPTRTLQINVKQLVRYPIRSWGARVWSVALLVTILETPLKLFWNTLENLFKLYWNSFETFSKHNALQSFLMCVDLAHNVYDF